METHSTASIPDLGAVIDRHKLTRIFLNQRPSLTIACAPAGYGKSVLATQIAALPLFEEVFWVSGFDGDMHGETILRSVQRSLCGRFGEDDGSPDEMLHRHARDESTLAISEALARRTNPICVVVDGCDHITDAGTLVDLAKLIRSLTSPLSSLVLTCRRISCSHTVDLSQALIFEERDLRFTEDEVLKLQVLNCRSHNTDETPGDLLSRFGGHPALTSLMLRHCSLDVDMAPPRDLVWYVDRMVGSLSEDGLLLAYAAALLIEDDLSALKIHDRQQMPEAMNELLSLSPLLVIGEPTALKPKSFRIHAVLRDSVRRRVASSGMHTEAQDCRLAALSYLEGAQALDRVLTLLQLECSDEEVAHWCQWHGRTLLRSVGAEPTARIIDRIPPSLVSGNPALLLLRASVLREQELYEEARTAAFLAADLADLDGDSNLASSSLLLAAWLGVDSSRLDVLEEALTRLEQRDKAGRSEGAECLVLLGRAILEIQSGCTTDTLQKIERVLESTRASSALAREDADQVVNALAGISGMYAGAWATSARLMTALVSRGSMSPSRRVLIQANLAVCYLELGSLRESKTLLDQVILETDRAGLRHLSAYAYGTRSCVNYGLGDTASGFADFETCNKSMGVLAHEDARAVELLNAAVNRRAVGLTEEALSLVEHAELVVRQGSSVYLVPRNLVELEAAASHLSMGDVWNGRTRAQEVRTSLAGSGAMGHLLRADLILAEADRHEGDVTTAISRLSEHAHYIATGSANWLIAMYARAFPGLLGILTQAIGAEALPLRMLLMVPVDTLEAALQLAPYLTEDEQRILRCRRGADNVAPDPVTTDSVPQSIEHSCYARLFGGLEVTTKAGVVNEDDWRKRKARLLFLALLLKQHQDVPRDVILERLWPDMDEEHAKRNFYVTWSTMKRALACGGVPADAKSFVQCSGGVCRATRQVRSDLDDFDETLSVLRSAEAAGDSDAVLAAARRLVDLYRGELLPGDLYEEWFAEARDRTKHDFCDAMMAAASAAESRRESETALLFLRKASAADAWREDVYQSMMRCQMNAGQRSRAIETYLSCRSRLTEDLGIDPSVETTRIYQAVLAMEG